MTTHIQAFRAQSDFAPEAKIKVGNNIWTPETAGARLYEQVLSKNPGSVQQVIDLAAKLDAPFTAKAVQGHLKWLFTGGQLSVNDRSFEVAAKPVKPEAKPEPKAEKPAKAKAEKAKVVAARKRSLVKTKKAA